MSLRGGKKPEKGREAGRIFDYSYYPLYYLKSATSPSLNNQG
jgi:hypothetical protein